ncbi:MAG: hypothetical protein PHG63_03360 [Candidatus Dojkabacteria bacterium]|nr:hypothetical protein [Candidatus Dojkabacteria bacterium]
MAGSARRISKKTGVIRRILRGCFVGVAGVIFIAVLGALISIVIFVVRYEVWLGGAREEIAPIIEGRSEDRTAVQASIQQKLKKFQQSTVQKEVLRMDCEEAEVYIEDVALENWGMTSDSVGLTCSDRRLDLYFKLWDLWWTKVRLWQRAEGALDIAVYDVTVGPFSAAGVTMGSLSSAMSEGVKDAISLVSGGNYSGRTIDELYISDDGLRLIGVLPE